MGSGRSGLMPLRGLTQRMLLAYPQRLLRQEHARQRPKRQNERPIEFAFVFRQMARLYPRTVLDVGTGTTALPSLMRTTGAAVTAIDNIRDYWVRGMVNPHYHVIDDDITRTRLAGTFDMITCVSVLEHVTDHVAAMRNMVRLLAPGGHLVVTCPYTERSYVPNVYALPGSSYGRDAPYVCQSYARATLEEWLAASGARVVEQELWRCWTGDAWTVGEQVVPPEPVASPESPHQLTCLLLASSG